MAVSGYEVSEPRFAVYGNLVRRICVNPGNTVLELNGFITASGLQETQISNEPASRVQEFPSDVLIYLLESRYCEPD